MPYIAHVGIQLLEDFTAYEKNKWFFIKTAEGLNFHWRLSDKNVYEVVCELFTDKQIALLSAKNMYVTAIYNLLYKGIKIEGSGCRFYERYTFIPEVDENVEDYPECMFFRSPNSLDGGIGPDVYEVPTSFEEYDKIYGETIDLSMDAPYLSCYIPRTDRMLDFDNYDKSYYFVYSKKTQPLLYTIIQADTAYEIGLQMTIYCGLLEHIAEDKSKNPDVITEIDSLINHVNLSSLSQEDKLSLISFLKSGKTISSRQKCRSLCQKYAKEQYGSYTMKEILDAAYSVRSAFSHGADYSHDHILIAAFIKFVVLDVIKGYALNLSDG